MSPLNSKYSCKLMQFSIQCAKWTDLLHYAAGPFLWFSSHLIRETYPLDSYCCMN